MYYLAVTVGNSTNTDNGSVTPEPSNSPFNDRSILSMSPFDSALSLMTVNSSTGGTYVIFVTFKTVIWCLLFTNHDCSVASAVHASFTFIVNTDENSTFFLISTEISQDHLPRTINDAYLTGLYMDQEDTNMVYYTTQMGIHSYNQATKGTCSCRVLLA